jgi:hypothetical protein
MAEPVMIITRAWASTSPMLPHAAKGWSAAAPEYTADTLPAGALAVVPITRLYDRSNVMLPAELLHAAWLNLCFLCIRIPLRSMVSRC